ncbi:hypothetical protein ACA910_008712 [Epithemia clementina (nom. ined.)]
MSRDPASRKEEECCGGRCCPYGASYIGPIIATVIAVLFTLVVPWSCEYFQVEYMNQEKGGVFFGVDQPSVFSIGPWSIEDFNMTNSAIVGTGACVPWSEHETLDESGVDGALSFARAVLFLVAIPAYVLTIVFCFGSCCVFEPYCLKCISFSFIACGILCPFGLVSLASSWCKDADNCQIKGSGISLIAMFFLWIAAGASILKMKEKEKRMNGGFAGNNNNNNNNNNNIQMVTTQTVNTSEHTLVEEDGTVVKVTIKTVQNADGTRSVTESRQILQQRARPPTLTYGAGATIVGIPDDEYVIPTAKAIV